jgi:hypothetical protein
MAYIDFFLEESGRENAVASGGSALSQKKKNESSFFKTQKTGRQGEV